jgi:hypothetical protein
VYASIIPLVDAPKELTRSLLGGFDSVPSLSAVARLVDAFPPAVQPVETLPPVCDMPDDQFRSPAALARAFTACCTAAVSDMISFIVMLTGAPNPPRWFVSLLQQTIPLITSAVAVNERGANDFAAGWRASLQKIASYVSLRRV